MKPISNEKRELLIGAKQRGEKEKDIAKWLDISQGAVGTIWRVFRKTGSFLPIPYVGRKSVITEEKIEEIHSAIKSDSDITLGELIEKLSLPIKKSQLSRLLISLGYSLKKNDASSGARPSRRTKETRKVSGRHKNDKHGKPHSA